MENKFELGPLQKEWIKQLREHPERQHKDALGERDGKGNLKLCCLGQALVVIKGGIDKCNFHEDQLHEGEDEFTALTTSYKEIGLRNLNGELKESHGTYGPLIAMNDGDSSGKALTWLQIADYIESNPENVFVESK